MKKVQMRFCPRCKSNNVGIKMELSMVFGFPQKWKCHDCGFEMYNFPIMEKETK